MKVDINISVVRVLGTDDWNGRIHADGKLYGSFEGDLNEVCGWLKRSVKNIERQADEARSKAQS